MAELTHPALVPTPRYTVRTAVVACQLSGTSKEYAAGSVEVARRTTNRLASQSPLKASEVAQVSPTGTGVRFGSPPGRFWSAATYATTTSPAAVPAGLATVTRVPPPGSRSALVEPTTVGAAAATQVRKAVKAVGGSSRSEPSTAVLAVPAPKAASVRPAEAGTRTPTTAAATATHARSLTGRDSAPIGTS